VPGIDLDGRRSRRLAGFSPLGEGADVVITSRDDPEAGR